MLDIWWFGYTTFGFWVGGWVGLWKLDLYILLFLTCGFFRYLGSKRNSLELREKQVEKEEKQKTKKIETSAEKLGEALKRGEKVNYNIQYF